MKTRWSGMAKGMTTGDRQVSVDRETNQVRCTVARIIVRASMSPFECSRQGDRGPWSL
jgi:hypothetical protein